jgi:hypothetical protein
MKIVKQGEKRTVGTKIADENIVEVRHVTLNKPTRSHYALKWAFDFSGVSREDLLKLAARGLVIDQRPKFKAEKNSDKLEQWDNKTFTVARILAKERVRQSAEEKAAKAVEALDVETQIEMLKKLLEQKGISA